MQETLKRNILSESDVSTVSNASSTSVNKSRTTSAKSKDHNVQNEQNPIEVENLSSNKGKTTLVSSCSNNSSGNVFKEPSTSKVIKKVAKDTIERDLPYNSVCKNGNNIQETTDEKEVCMICIIVHNELSS